MVDVKWIKITTDIFDNRKIRQIECMPEGDAIIVIWVKLLCLAGTINDNGLVYVTKEVPYTDQMLSYQFNRPLSTVQLALETFRRLSMVELIDNMLAISNWEKYQNIEGMDRIREQNRIRKQRQREREKLLLTDNHVKSRDSHATEEKREEKNRKEKKRTISKDIVLSGTIQQVVDAWNAIECKAIPKIVSIKQGTTRYGLLKARIEDYGLEAVLNAISVVERSKFLQGENDRKWTITFDWMLKPNNFPKVLEGNYADKNQPEEKAADEWKDY